MNKNVIIGIVLVVGLGAGFFGGMTYQKGQQGSLTAAGGNRFIQNGQIRRGTGVNNQGFRPINGTILNADDKSISVKLEDGSSKIILFNSNTQINKADTASSADLKTGMTVMVFGQTNSDGSVTASNIQLNPIQQMNLRPTAGQ